MVTDESSNLGLPDFPVDNLPPLIEMMNRAPNISVYNSLQRLYPYKAFLPEEGCASVEETLTTFQLINRVPDVQELAVETVARSSADSSNSAKVEVSVDGRLATVSVPAGPHKVNQESESASSYVHTRYQDNFIADLMLSHSSSYLRYLML